MRALNFNSSIRKTFPVKTVFVAFTWLLGLLAGAFLLNQTSFTSLMRSVLFLRMSIVGLFVSLAIPLLLSYILLRFLHFYFVLPFIFLKAFSFFSCYGGVMLTFGNAGWLVCGMILFSDFFLVVLLLLQWFDAATGKRHRPYVYFVVYFLIPTIIGCYDYFVVSPYAAMLLNY